MIEDVVQKVKKAIEGRVYDLSDEIRTQNDIEQAMYGVGLEVSREYRLSPQHIVDFMINDIAIEVKVKGQATNILRQCEGYCGFDEVKALILVTGRSIGFPQELKGKPCYYISLSRGML